MAFSSLVFELLTFDEIFESLYRLIHIILIVGFYKLNDVFNYR